MMVSESDTLKVVKSILRSRQLCVRLLAACHHGLYSSQLRTASGESLIISICEEGSTPLAHRPFKDSNGNDVIETNVKAVMLMEVIYICRLLYVFISYLMFIVSKRKFRFWKSQMKLVNEDLEVGKVFNSDFEHPPKKVELVLVT